MKQRVRAVGGISGIGGDGASIEAVEKSEGGVEGFLEAIHRSLKDKTCRPEPVQRVYIPKAKAQNRPSGSRRGG